MIRVMLMAWLWLCLDSYESTAKPLYTIIGKITGIDKQSIPFAWVGLYAVKDSSLIKVTACDDQGVFNLEFETLNPEAYYIKVSMTFYENYYSNAFSFINSTEPIDLGSIQMNERNQSINEITVTASKPFIERKSDRYVMNVESSITAAGSSAFELLEKAPGVTINYLDALSMKGKSGVQVLIDGKPIVLSGSELANYLKALPSNMLDRIEIISNPPAKYEAAGNAGIIDIRLKKNQAFGTNGSINANYGQGVYPKSGIGLNLNHRNKRFNWFGNSNYSYRKGLNKLILYREFFENGQRTGAYDQYNYLVFPFHFASLRMGTDYTLPNNKTTLGFIINSSLNRFEPHGQNNSIVENEQSLPESSFSTSNQSKDIWPSYSFNFNGKHVMDSSGMELSFDLDYAQFKNTTEQNFLTKYFDLNQHVLKPDYYLYGDLKGNLDIKSIKIDLSKKISNNRQFESGLKSSVVSADNNLAFFDKSNAQPVYDSSKSNHFLYKEQIHAAYLNYKQDWTHLSLQAGLRSEFTKANGNQLVNNFTFEKNYVNLFPSVFLNYKFTPNYDMGINLSRRLDRPNYQQLNPFKFFLDPSTYREGNPFLNPQYSWIFEWNHTLNKNYAFSISYTQTLDNITEVIGPVEGLDRVTVQTHENLTQFENLSVSANGTIDILKNWSSVINVSSWIGKYTGTFANTLLQDGNLVVNLSCNNTIKLPKNWNSEINFSYQSPEVYGFMKVYSMWGLSVGIQKQFLNKKLNAKLSVSDLFWTNLPEADINYRDYYEHFDVKRETRVASLSLSYRFGSLKLGNAPRKAGGVEEEKRRASNGQG